MQVASLLIAENVYVQSFWVFFRILKSVVTDALCPDSDGFDRTVPLTRGRADAAVEQCATL